QALSEGRPGAGVLDELVHQAAVGGLLLGRVVVVLVAGQGLGSVEPLRVAQVGVGGEQGLVQPVHARCVTPGPEYGLPLGVGGDGVGSEVVVEGDVFLEDDDQVLDRGGGLERGGRVGAV